MPNSEDVKQFKSAERAKIEALRNKLQEYIAEVKERDAQAITAATSKELDNILAEFEAINPLSGAQQIISEEQLNIIKGDYEYLTHKAQRIFSECAKIIGKPVETTENQTTIEQYQKTRMSDLLATPVKNLSDNSIGVVTEYNYQSLDIMLKESIDKTSPLVGIIKKLMEINKEFSKQNMERLDIVQLKFEFEKLRTEYYAALSGLGEKEREEINRQFKILDGIIRRKYILLTMTTEGGIFSPSLAERNYLKDNANKDVLKNIIAFYKQNPQFMVNAFESGSMSLFIFTLLEDEALSRIYFSMITPSQLNNGLLSIITNKGGIQDDIYRALLNRRSDGEILAGILKFLPEADFSKDADYARKVVNAYARALRDKPDIQNIILSAMNISLLNEEFAWTYINNKDQGEAAREKWQSLLADHVKLRDALARLHDVDKAMYDQLLPLLRAKLNCPDNITITDFLNNKINAMDKKAADIPGLGLKELPYKFDLNNYPEKKKSVNSNILTIGDLHGNYLKLIYLLAYYDVIDISSKDYNEFVKLFKIPPALLTKNDSDRFNELLKGIKIKNNEVVLKLIGDILSDRQGNDDFTSRLLKYIADAGMNYTIKMSNHDALFMRSLSTLGQDAFRSPLGEGQSQSVSNLDFLIKHGISNREEVISNFNQVYMPRLKLIDYQIAEDGKSMAILSHAGIGLDEIKNLIDSHPEFKGLSYKDGTLDELKSTLDAVNARFIERCQTLGYDRFPEDLKSDLKTVQDRKNRPLEAIFWNRNYDYLRRPVVHGRSGSEYRVFYIQGHDSSETNRPENVGCVDNPFGKEANLMAVRAEIDIGTEMRDRKTLAVLAPTSPALQFDAIDDLYKHPKVLADLLRYRTIQGLKDLSEESINSDLNGAFERIAESNAETENVLKHMVLSPSTPELRALRINSLIDVIQQALYNKDYQSVDLILQILRDPEIHDLHATMNLLPQSQRYFLNDMIEFWKGGKDTSRLVYMQNLPGGLPGLNHLQEISQEREGAEKDRVIAYVKQLRNTPFSVHDNILRFTSLITTESTRITQDKLLKKNSRKAAEKDEKKTHVRSSGYQQVAGLSAVDPVVKEDYLNRYKATFFSFIENIYQNNKAKFTDRQPTASFLARHVTSYFKKRELRKDIKDHKQIIGSGNDASAELAAMFRILFLYKKSLEHDLPDALAKNRYDMIDAILNCFEQKPLNMEAFNKALNIVQNGLLDPKLDKHRSIFSSGETRIKSILRDTKSVLYKACNEVDNIDKLMSAQTSSRQISRSGMIY